MLHLIDDEQPITKIVWDEKYRHKNPDGSSDEETREDSYRRVIRGVFQNDKREEGDLALRSMLRNHWVPAGRIHAGAGTNKRVTWINCYVSPDIEDSMETEVGENSAGIMDALKVAALTQQMGGGIGMDFSTLRPRGALVGRTGSVSSGPLHFMDMWHSMCSTVMSSGARRGAMMGTMRIDHPDIVEFIEAKHRHGRLTNFNVSVLVTEPFMKALKDDAVWNLGFRTPRADGKHILTITDDPNKPWYVYEQVKARDLWDRIIRSTYEFAEPGVIFVDRINAENNLAYCEYIHCTNPCGEQPLPPNGDCNLGAVNLAALVHDPFTDRAQVMWDLLDEAVRVGVRFLDNVLDNTIFPTKEQEKEAKAKRRIGLGITGLGNMLQQLKLRYGSNESLNLVHNLMMRIRDTAYDASASLAMERGSFPLYDPEFLNRPFVKRLPARIREKIRLHGIRNGVLLTIAPTGTTSLYVGNVSSGCEPSFAWSFRRKMLKPDGSLEEIPVEDYGYRLFRKANPEFDPANTQLPPYMVSALELTVDDHLKMQAVLQTYVDASISKTVNCPKDMTFEEFKRVYDQAYTLGLKGCTTYRPSDVRGAILTVDSPKKVESPSKVIDVWPRPEELEGTTYKVRWPPIDHAFYVTINDRVDPDGKLTPFEVFINSKSVVHQEWIAALTRTISAVFRRGGDLSFLPAELEQVHSADGGAFVGGKYVPSLVAMIGQTITRHFKKIGVIKVDDPDKDGHPEVNGMQGERCPKCQQPKSLMRAEGCKKCLSCGYSTCG